MKIRSVVRMRLLGLVFLIAQLSGCVSIDPVQPWQKGTLARPEMTFDDDPLEKGFREHIYSSKESASGGSGVGGGGCGCN
jgi:hypothetical protein